MKNSILWLFMWLTSPVFSQNWNWAVGENIQGEGLAVCHDNAGSIYLSGILSSSGSIGGQSITTNSSKGMIIKYNSSGAFQWFRTAIGQSACGYGVESDNSGNVFLAGCFANTVNLGTTTLTGGSSISPMLIKYDTNGNLLWAITSQTTTGSGNSLAYSVSTDALGNSVIAGYFSTQTIAFGSQVATKPTTATAAYFVAKFDPNGNALWVKTCNAGYAAAAFVDVDANNNIYVTGYFNGTLTVSSSTLVSAGSFDYFVAKYDAGGNLVWLNGGGGSAYDNAFCVYADAGGDVYIAGAYNSTNMVVASNTLTNVGSRDAFIVKYSANGTAQWARSIGSPGVDAGYSLDNFNGSIYMAGGMLATSLTVGPYTLTANNTFDAMFLVQYDPNGQLVSANALDGGGDDQMAITVSGCNLYLGGDLWNNNGAPVAFGSHSVIPTGAESLFLASTQTFPYQPITVTGGGSVCAGTSLTLTASGAGSYTWVGSPAGNSIVITPTASTNYTVLSQSSLSCMPTASTTQSVVVLASPTLSAKNYTFCSGDKRTISVSGADTYTWYNGTKTSSVIVQPTVNTTYTVTGTNTLTGCTNTIGISMTKSPCTGIGEQNLHSTVRIYPNPCSSFVNIEADESGCVFQLMDGLGRVVRAGELTVGRREISVDGFPPGVYFFTAVQNGKVLHSQKLVIN